MAAAVPYIVMGAISGVQAIMQARQASKAAKASEAAGVQNRAAAESMAGLHEYNASIARMQAADAIERGAEDEARFRQSLNLLIGTQTAATAANNIDVNYGSAVDVRADAAFLGEMDALTIRTNAAREAWGFNVAATDYGMRAEIARKEGVMLEAAGASQAGLIRSQSRTDLLTTAAGVAGSYFSSSLAGRYGFGRRQSVPQPAYRGDVGFSYAAPGTGYSGGFRNV